MSRLRTPERTRGAGVHYRHERVRAPPDQPVGSGCRHCSDRACERGSAVSGGSAPRLRRVAERPLRRNSFIRRQARVRGSGKQLPVGNKSSVPFSSRAPSRPPSAADASADTGGCVRLRASSDRGQSSKVADQFRVPTVLTVGRAVIGSCRGTFAIDEACRVLLGCEARETEQHDREWAKVPARGVFSSLAHIIP